MDVSPNERYIPQKQELTQRGQPTHGLKAALVERLELAL